MPSERTQRRIDRLLDEAERALDEHDWLTAAERGRDALLLDQANQDAANFVAAAEHGLAAAEAAQHMLAASAAGGGPGEMRRSPLPLGEGQGEGPPEQSTNARDTPSSLPTAFANGRYEVKRFLGEGGKKKVYLAHDTLLDRDVAFALIKTDGLDAAGRDRIKREAQAMGRLGSHPHIVSVFDLGEEPPSPSDVGVRFIAPARGEGSGEGGQPYIVTELMGGGDVQELIEKAPDHRPELARTLQLSIEVCR